MSNFPHYFIAIPLPKRLQQFLADWQSELKTILPYKQWTNIQDLHITLKYLGPVPDIKLKDLIKRLHAISFTPFHIQVGSIGMFGTSAKPRVLYAAVELSEALADLQQQVESVVSHEGFVPERRSYTPHITLAKKWNGSNSMPDEIEHIKRNFTEQKRLDVDQFLIYRIFPKESPTYRMEAIITAKGGGGTGAIN
ncbi:RNA 2',3'-cyclic phosphodiesterase [Virgibacillus proomii]|jgi:RNA 2',3'-cyclic 3'-phosphodiesterase|uniref:RNA 2',3'-cyclic phosphodiesterase n=1 Tax=Virgibacillus proomii TaxID=84407 RepID=UPI000987B02E|nr:RNA 2',3'-cyclic phosphodiesterase [Virgibacillus proomii]